MRLCMLLCSEIEDSLRQAYVYDGLSSTTLVTVAERLATKLDLTGPSRQSFINKCAGRALAVQQCNCEHESHDPDGDGHTYGRAAAGSQSAVYVGPVCDYCANTHMNEYIVGKV